MWLFLLFQISQQKEAFQTKMGRDVERAESEEDLEKKRKEEEEELKAAKKRQVNKRVALEINKGTTEASKGTLKNLNCSGNFGQHWCPRGCHHYGLIGPCHCQLQGE